MLDYSESIQTFNYRGHLIEIHLNEEGEGGVIYIDSIGLFSAGFERGTLFALQNMARAVVDASFEDEERVA